MNFRNASKTLFLIFVLLLSSCITILKHAPEDGYAIADKSQLKSFKEDSVAVVTDTLQFIEVDAEGLKKVIAKSDKTLLVFWATWCGVCHLEMPGLLEKAKNKNIVFVTVDYNIKSIKKIMNKGNYNKPVYIVSAQSYGNNESVKASTFLKEITNVTDSMPSFPKHLYFKNDQLSEIVPGRMSPEQVDKLFGK